MLLIDTNVGNFSRFQDLLMYMKEEHLKEIEVYKVEYCLSEIIGKGIYTFEEIEQIVNGVIDVNGEFY